MRSRTAVTIYAPRCAVKIATPLATAIKRASRPVLLNAQDSAVTSNATAILPVSPLAANKRVVMIRHARRTVSITPRGATVAYVAFPTTLVNQLIILPVLTLVINVLTGRQREIALDASVVGTTWP